MGRTVHVVLTDYGRFGWGVSSPQLPGFIGGRETLEQLRADLAGLLDFAGVGGGDVVVKHCEKLVDLPTGDELLVRVASDEHLGERSAVSTTLVGALRVASQVNSMLDMPARPTGEVLFVCAMRADTVGWVLSQLDSGDAACVVVGHGAGVIRAQPFARGPHGDSAVGWQRLSDAGLDEGSTIGEILAAQDAGAIDRGRELILA